MTTITAVAPTAATPAHRQRVLGLLREVDHEFVPPLSVRVDTWSLEAVAAPVNSPRRLAAYLQAMQEEAWLLALEEEQVVAVLSYSVDYGDPVLTAYCPCLHVTTIAVTASRRGSGLATALYDALFAEAVTSDVPWITTRTWSTNTSHVRLLYDRGFREVARQPRQDRVESVYLAQSVAPGGPSAPGTVRPLLPDPATATGSE